MSLSSNLEDVKKRIAQAALRAGRLPEDITLIAVSKTKPVSMISEIYEAGVRDFGENKVQEITAKSPVLPEDIRWHMIGHLQRNKVKQVIDRACLIHSVDSMRLAVQISEEAKKKGITVPVLLEVNIAGEESKYGFTAEETARFLPDIAALGGITVRGLMTNMDYLSMGMTNDFEVAVKEGATHVRVGTAIFGEREYNL